MTGSWDKTVRNLLSTIVIFKRRICIRPLILQVKFWDLRVQQPVVTLQLPERVYCADVESQIGVVSTAGRQIIVYDLKKNPPEGKKIASKLKYEHRCISIFEDKKGCPSGFAVGSVEGRVAVQNFNNKLNSNGVMIITTHKEF